MLSGRPSENYWKFFASFDHLIRPEEQLRWNRQAQRLRRLEVDREVVPFWPLDRQGARGGSLEDPIHVARGPAEVVALARPVRHQPAVLDQEAVLVHGRDPMRARQVDDALAGEQR